MSNITRIKNTKFNMIKPNKSLVCDYYGLHNPNIHLIRHFAKQ